MAMRTTRVRLVVVVLAALGLVGTVACSVRSDDQPRAIPKDALPKVLSQANPSTTTPTATNPAARPYAVYLVRTQGTNESLTSVKVDMLPPANPEDLPRMVIERLVNNPPVTDNSDLKSDIPPGVSVRRVARDPAHPDVLEIDLRNLGDIQNANQRLAVAQIVFTATAIEEAGINGVRFFVDGQPIAVPLDEKTSAPGDVISRDDFPQLRPGASAATTTTQPTDTEVAPEATAPDAAPPDAGGIPVPSTETIPSK